MYFPTILTLAATLATTTFASPTAEASPELAARATKCIPGQVYCGWWLIDQQGTYIPPLRSPTTHTPSNENCLLTNRNY
jgi:hypothetical protein